MSDKKFDHAKAISIIRFSYKAFRTKETNGRSKSQTVDDIINMIKKEVKEDAAQKD